MDGTVVNDSWPEDRVAELRKLLAEGHTCSVIGRKLGVSRNAVIGKKQRLQLKGNPPKTAGPRKPSGEDVRQQVVKLNGLGVGYAEIARRVGRSVNNVYDIARSLGLERAPHPSKATAPRRVVPVATATNAFDRFLEGYEGQKGRVSLIELEAGMCRFPIDMPEGPVRYCGSRAEEGGSFCPHHAARCFNGVPSTTVELTRKAIRRFR